MAETNQRPPVPAGTTTSQMAFSDSETAEVWLSFAQSRFDDANKRINDFRGWSRQIVTWIGVIVALEMNLFPKISEKLHLLNRTWNAVIVVAIGLIIVCQLCLLFHAARTGFIASKVQSPEDPSKLGPHLLDLSAHRVREIIAAYFANSYDTYNAKADRICHRLESTLTQFIVTVWAFAITNAGLFWFTRS